MLDSNKYVPGENVEGDLYIDNSKGDYAIKSVDFKLYVEISYSRFHLDRDKDFILISQQTSKLDVPRHKNS